MRILNCPVRCCEGQALQCRVLKIDERELFTRLVKTCVVETIGGVTVKEVAGS